MRVHSKLNDRNNLSARVVVRITMYSGGIDFLATDEIYDRYRSPLNI